MNSQLVNYTKTVIDDIISLIYQISELPYRYQGDSYGGLNIALEFAGFSRQNRFETINENVMGSEVAYQLESLDLKSLEDYRNSLLRELANEIKRQQQHTTEIKRLQEEQIRQQQEEDYLHQHGMFGNLDY